MRFLLLSCFLLLTACSFGGSDLAGNFRIERIDDVAVPAEYPPGSGHMLEDGTLVLDEGRFARRFLRVGAQEVESLWMTEEGAFEIRGDSLILLPEEALGIADTRFHITASTPELRLRDGNGREWTYSRSGN